MVDADWCSPPRHDDNVGMSAESATRNLQVRHTDYGRDVVFFPAAAVAAFFGVQKAGSCARTSLDT